MARFVSHYRGYIYGVRAGTPEMRDPQSGYITREGVPDLEAKFTHDLVDEEAITLAKLDRSDGGLAQIKPKPDGSMPAAPFHGMQEDDAGRPLPIEIRLAVFDSEIAKLHNGWSDADEALVVEKLRGSSRNGIDFVEVVPTPADRPWPGYDDVTDPERILEIVALIGADLTKVAAYERENQNRQPVLDALAEAAQAEETIVVNA